MDNNSYVTLTGVSGEVGLGITPGTGKAVAWEANKEWPRQTFPSVTIRVVADDLQPSGPEPDGFITITAGSFVMGSPT